MSTKKKTAAAWIAKNQETPVEMANRAPSGPSRKVTVSLFSADLEASDYLAELLRTNCGILANRSDAVKIALRIAMEKATPEDVKRHYANYKQEDGRNQNRV